MSGGLSDLIPGHKLCCVCATYVAVDQLYVDVIGERWDMCADCGELEKSIHDPLCPQIKSPIIACDCEFIANIRNDERSRG